MKDRDIVRRALDSGDVCCRTANSKRYVNQQIKLANDLIYDPEKESRISQAKCLACHYIFGKLSYGVRRSTNCRICNKNLSSCNINIDEICIDCANKHELCVVCVADIKLRVRRKFKF